MDAMPIRMVCENCRSEQVTRDAWVEWDVAAQQWVLGTVFDYAYCHQCQGSTRVEALVHRGPPPVLRERRRGFVPAPLPGRPS